MRKISVVRRVNLQSVLVRGDLNRIAKYLDKNPNYLSQLFSRKAKNNISSDLARGVESALGLKPNFLDKPIKLVNHREGEAIKPVSAIANDLFDIVFASLFSGLTIKKEVDGPFGTHAQWMAENSGTPHAVALICNLDVFDVDTTRKHLLACMLAFHAKYGVMAIEDDGLHYEYFLNNDGQAVHVDSDTFNSGN